MVNTQSPPLAGIVPPSPERSVSAQPPAQRRRRRVAPGGSPSNYLYLLPALLLVGGVIYYSLGYTAWLSLFNWDGISPDRTFVGIGNYLQAFADPIFWRSVGNMAIFTSTVLLQMILGLAIAVFMQSRMLAKTLYKVIVFIPVVLSPAIMAPIWREILAPAGAVNTTLQALGLNQLAHPWLADPATALWALVAINVWQWTGLSFLLYYAAIGQIESSIIEAARIDGSGTLQTIRYILVPQVRGTTLTLAILGVIGVLKTFDLPYLVTQGGPANSSQFLSTYIYQQGLTDLHAGYGAALSVLLLAMSLVFTAYQVARYRRTAQ